MVLILVLLLVYCVTKGVSQVLWASAATDNESSNSFPACMINVEIKLVNIYESTWKAIKQLINRKFIIVILKITPNFDHKKWFWINQPRADKPLFCYRLSAITSAGCGLVQHWIWQAWGMNDVKCTPSEHCHLHTILSLPWMWHRQMPSHLFTTTFFFTSPK